MEIDVDVEMYNKSTFILYQQYCFAYNICITENYKHVLHGKK